MSAMEAAEPRMLYEPGFEGWDIGVAGIVTDYVIAVIGLSLAFFMLWRAYKDSEPSGKALSMYFVAFSALEGLTFGFGGGAHNLLNGYFQAGEVLSKTWGEGNWGWMVSWTVAMLLTPFATAAGLGMSLAYAKVEGKCAVVARSCIAVAAVLVATWEVYWCAADIDQSSFLASLFSVLASVAGLALAFRQGVRSASVWIQVVGWTSRILGYMVLLTVPASCKVPQDELTDCIYPSDFNHNAIFHVFIMLCLVLIFVSIGYPFAKAKASVATSP